MIKSLGYLSREMKSDRPIKKLVRVRKAFTAERDRTERKLQVQRKRHK